VYDQTTLSTFSVTFVPMNTLRFLKVTSFARKDCLLGLCGQSFPHTFSINLAFRYLLSLAEFHRLILFQLCERGFMSICPEGCKEAFLRSSFVFSRCLRAMLVFPFSHKERVPLFFKSRGQQSSFVQRPKIHYTTMTSHSY